MAGRPTKYVPGYEVGRLTVVGRLSRGRVRCRCDCGVLCDVAVSSLSSGRTRSCGCLRRELASKRRQRLIRSRDGVLASLTDHELRLGLQPGVVSDRIAAGWSPDAAVTHGRGTTRGGTPMRRIDWRNEPALGVEVDEALADAYGVTHSAVAAARVRIGVPRAPIERVRLQGQGIRVAAILRALLVAPPWGLTVAGIAAATETNGTTVRADVAAIRSGGWPVELAWDGPPMAQRARLRRP